MNPAIFAESLRRMADWYVSEHSSPGVITPVEAIQSALCDVAIAVERAAVGLVWKAPSQWEPYEDATGIPISPEILEPFPSVPPAFSRWVYRGEKWSSDAVVTYAAYVNQGWYLFRGTPAGKEGVYYIEAVK